MCTVDEFNTTLFCSKVFIHQVYTFVHFRILTFLEFEGNMPLLFKLEISKQHFFKNQASIASRFIRAIQYNSGRKIHIHLSSEILSICLVVISTDFSGINTEACVHRFASVVQLLWWTSDKYKLMIIFQQNMKKANVVSILETWVYFLCEHPFILV